MDDEFVGGYYDAGDHVKFGFPMAGMTTILAWGGISFYDAYEKAGLLEAMDDCLKWSFDYTKFVLKSRCLSSGSASLQSPKVQMQKRRVSLFWHSESLHGSRQ